MAKIKLVALKNLTKTYILELGQNPQDVGPAEFLNQLRVWGMRTGISFTVLPTDRRLRR